MANKIETVGEPKKVKVYYTKIQENGDTAIYVFTLFGQPVYVRVRFREKMRNMFVWLLDPVVEKVGLSLSEVTQND